MKGDVSTPDNPGRSKVMLWIRDVALKYAGDECLTWPFGRIWGGYGTIGREGKCIGAHRYICQWVHGDPPSPACQAAHSCRKGHEGCVNPRHLSWLTVVDNAKDAGPRKSLHKLTPRQVAEIHKFKGRKTPRELAAKYGVREVSIRRIWNGTRWTTGQVVYGGFAKLPWTHDRRKRHAVTN